MKNSFIVLLFLGLLFFIISVTAGLFFFIRPPLEKSIDNNINLKSQKKSPISRENKSYIKDLALIKEENKSYFYPVREIYIKLN